MMLSGSARLLELMEEPIEDAVPSGWKTTAEIAKEIGMSWSTVSRLMREGMSTGKVECRKFRVERGGVLRPVPYYFVRK